MLMYFKSNADVKGALVHDELNAVQQLLVVRKHQQLLVGVL